SILDYLCEDCKSHFEKVKAALDALGIAYKINDRIVRGLDYYTRTVFEFTT
ncbi:MAG TPA: histidine--tRNA ligase, partial [Ruminococcaceae bacterium]|nr:histidine--tRNA ligase [Oscillospiraceae bacterium]